jgi:hypothetical protein
MTAVTVVAVVVWTIAIAAFVPLVIHGSGSGDLPTGLAVALGVFGFMTVALFFVLLAFAEDMSRLGLSRDEKLRWQFFLVTLGPAAAAMYWWRYVRVLDGHEQARSS